MKPKQVNGTTIEKNNNEVLKYIVAIGTSTGGPRALQSVIPMFPAKIPAALLVVQHMPPGFTRLLAERLNNMSQVTVKEAENDETIKAGYVYIAPGNYHMKVSRAENDLLKVKLSEEPPLSGHRPSVDVLMESLANTGFSNIIGVIMTGMGNDGSEGIFKLKKKNNAFIITQDEKSCVVYGMPKAALQTGVVDKVLPLTEIAREIMKIVEVHE